MRLCVQQRLDVAQHNVAKIVLAENQVQDLGLIFLYSPEQSEQGCHLCFASGKEVAAQHAVHYWCYPPVDFNTICSGEKSSPRYKQPSWHSGTVLIVAFPMVDNKGTQYYQANGDNMHTRTQGTPYAVSWVRYRDLCLIGT